MKLSFNRLVFLLEILLKLNFRNNLSLYIELEKLGNLTKVATSVNTINTVSFCFGAEVKV